MIEKIDYKQKCMEVFSNASIDTGSMRVLAYTGEKIYALPVFRIVTLISPCVVRLGAVGKEYYGFCAINSDKHDVQWYNYNDCVSLNNWDNIERLLDARFEWMKLNPAIRAEVIQLAKEQLYTAGEVFS